ncbi:type II secretion system protein, partial [bacterium]|nr:type II secretion system protein [bacterium]
NAKDTLCIGALLHRRQIFDWKHHALVLISYVKNLRNRRSLLVPLRGFTLAEVLITLGIIGVVAALTIPTLMQKTNEREIISALKKSHSNLSQAYKLAKVEHGSPDTWYNEESDVNDTTRSTLMGEIFKPYLKNAKYCGTGTGLGCFDYETSVDFAGNEKIKYGNETYLSKFILADGTSIFFFSYGGTARNLGGPYKKSYGSIGVDINGAKLPNKKGVDTFLFIITEDTILPFGINGVEDTYAFPNACSSTSTNNDACAAWVIYNDNMDYLHCDDLSWNGKQKCD